MMLLDDKTIVVKDYIDIIIMNDHYFKIEMKDCFYHIKGKEMMIHYLDDYEIRLSGIIDVITYDKL
ncbi:MAG: YabP/YqfC family sporulation protein [Erysipelotrichaceae bacterium]|nr:YabP/YqfC family sporulation protein [Erysipelotrichaceae bacterium]